MLQVMANENTKLRSNIRLNEPFVNMEDSLTSLWGGGL